MVWQEPERGRIAASLGHKVIMAPASWTYFDYATDETDTGRSPYSTFRPIEQVYAFDPVAPGIPPAMARNILGGQGCLWTEFITTEKDVEYMLLPRAIALAETLWSERDRMNFQGFSIRLRAELTRLGRAGINYRIPDRASTSGLVQIPSSRWRNRLWTRCCITHWTEATQRRHRPSIPARSPCQCRSPHPGSGPLPYCRMDVKARSTKLRSQRRT